jgi:hypothetical protein
MNNRELPSSNEEMERSAEPFEEQFAKREKIRVPGGPAEVGTRVGRATGKYLFGNLHHSMERAREGLALAESDIYSIVEDLHNAGIGTLLVGAVDDPVPPMKRLQKQYTEYVTESGDSEKRDLQNESNRPDKLWDGVLSTRGGHGFTGENPEVIGPLLVDMIRNVVEKKNRENAASEGSKNNG